MSTDLHTRDQRYYHVVIFGNKVPWSLNALWKAIDASQSEGFQDVHEDWGKVEFREVRTSTPLAPVSNDDQTQPRKDKAGNYLHDVFAIEINRAKERYVALGVPYLRLGHAFGERLRQARLLARADFVKADTQAIVEAVREGSAAEVGVTVSKVQVRVLGQDVRGFSLSAQNAVLSPLYGQIIGHIRQAEKRKAKEEGVEPHKQGVSFSQCTVRQLHSVDGAMSIHCDRHGNFRVWMQRNARNLGVVRHWLAALRALKAYSLVADYPMYRKHFDSEAESE